MAPHFYIHNLQALHGAFCHGSFYYQPLLIKTEAEKKKDNPIKKWSEHLNRHFPQEDTDGKKAHEKMPKILNYQKMQIKTPMKYHLTLERMAIIKKPMKNKC